MRYLFRVREKKPLALLTLPELAVWRLLLEELDERLSDGRRAHHHVLDGGQVLGRHAGVRGAEADQRRGEVEERGLEAGRESERGE